MSGQTRRPTRSLALVATLLMCGVGIEVPTNTARADDCLAEPNSPAPEGSHWYYHMDRATQRKCWYVRATDQSTQQHVAPATSEASAATAAPTLTKPAATGSPMSIIPSDSTPSLPRIKVLAVENQDAPVSGATADQSVQQNAQRVRPASSIAEPPAAEPGPSSQTSDQGAAPSPTGPTWPDPVVTTVKTPKPTAAPSDARAESGQATAHVRLSDNADSTAQGNASVTKAEMARSLTSWPVAIFSVAALGLIMAGFVLRIVTKISAGRRGESSSIAGIATGSTTDTSTIRAMINLSVNLTASLITYSAPQCGPHSIPIPRRATMDGETADAIGRWPQALQTKSVGVSAGG